MLHFFSYTGLFFLGRGGGVLWPNVRERELAKLHTSEDRVQIDDIQIYHLRIDHV